MFGLTNIMLKKGKDENRQRVLRKNEIPGYD